MKAILKETREPIEDLTIYDSIGNQWQLDDVELIHDTRSTKEIDWEQRRFELVKAAMQGLVSTETFCGREDDAIARMAISQADAVLAEYRKGEEE